MQITRESSYAGYDCVKINNGALALWVTYTVGPRIIGLEIKAGENLFAELPDATAECPGVGLYQFRGGHRLWHAPEDPRHTYLPDDEPAEISESTDGIKFTQPVEHQTGIQKSMTIKLPSEQAKVEVDHQLQNRGSQTVELAPWAITQFKQGGVAILPQTSTPSDQFGLLPNRQIALWPYTQANSKHISWGDQFIFIHANMAEGALKIGFPNPSGWIGYLREKVLFIKKAAFNPERGYFDFGSSSECYCNPSFLELETLGPRTKLEPGESLSHQETWQVYDQIASKITEQSVANLMARLNE